MHSTRIRRVAKARCYTAEPGRLRTRSLTLTVHGDHDDNTVYLTDDVWECNCVNFTAHAACAHVTAAQTLLAP